MPKQTLDEKYKMWRNRIDAGVKLNEEQAKDWEDAEKAYLGEILTPENSDFTDHLYSVNYQYVDVRSSTPKLFSQSPYIFIDAEDSQSDTFAEIMEKIVNQSLDSVWFVSDRMDSCVKETKLSGRSYIKVSFKFDQDKIGREYAGEEPNNEIILSFLRRCELIVPREAKNFKSARWVDHKITDKISAIRAKYKLKETDKVTPCEEEKDLPEGLSSDELEDFQYGTYHEIEDRENHELMILVDGVDRIVVKPYEIPYGYFSLYEGLEWNHIPGKFDTKPDFYFWKKQAIALAETKTQQHNHARKLNSKYKWRSPDGKGPSQEQQHALESYNDGVFVPLAAGHDFEPVQHAQIGQEVYLQENSTRQDLTMVSGLNEMKQGLPQVQKTARETLAIVNEAQDVLSYRSSQVEKFLAAIIEKIIWNIQHNYDTTRVVRLTGMEKAEYLGFQERVKSVKADGLKLEGTAEKPYLHYVGKNIAGKFKVRVKPGSTMPVNEMQRKQDLQEFIGLLIKAPQIMASIDPQELVKEIARTLHLENKGIILDTKSPEQENELLKRDVPIVPKLNEDHDAHLAAHERENNRTSSFIAHILTHKLMKNFLERSQAGQAPSLGAGAQNGLGRLGEKVSGVPMGSSIPPGAMPTPPQAGASPVPTPSVPGGPPPGIQ